jgi:hypothetical protein
MIGLGGNTVTRKLFCLCALGLLYACSPADQSKSPPPESTEAAKPAAKKNDVIVKDDKEKLFQNPFDPDAVYFLSQANGTANALSVLIKRDSQDGTQYSRWQFNCVAQTARNFGVAKNLLDLDKATNSMPSAPQHYELKSRLGAIAGAVCP